MFKLRWTLARHGSSSFFVLWLLTLALSALWGCDREKPAQPPAKKVEERPTLRIYAMAGAAGAVEPCGCVKDMLGGIDHAAAWVDSQRGRAPHSLVLGAGPMFFSDPTFSSDAQTQEVFKAEAMAASLKDLGLTAWAPGANDWAMGVPRFSELSKSSGAFPIAANLGELAGPVVATQILSAGGLKVGVTGISLPQYQNGKVEFEIHDAKQALLRSREELKKQGASILVALLAAQRGEALRLVEGVPGFHLAIVGKAYDQGEANDKPFTPELVGQTLVTQATNHLQGISVVDLIVREGDFSFADGTGLDALSRHRSLEHQVTDLATRISKLKESGQGQASDIASQEKRLVALKKELSQTPSTQTPQKGSYFLYDLVEIREGAGTHQGVASRLAAYYKRVNGYNREVFKDKKPRPAQEGKAHYVGVEICSNCHMEERAVWDKTRHAVAYGTLVSEHKEFNLDCVSCHVTGYEKPGGSTVTHVENFTSVQCEVCHGPGSQHAENPADKELIVGAPPRDLCASSCHHPPHVGDNWSVDDAWPKILGQGHGKL